MQYTILTIIAITAFVAACVVMHIRYRRKIARYRKTIDDCRRELQKAQESTKKIK